MEERGRNQAPVINVTNRATGKQSVAASIGATKIKRKQDIEVNRQTDNDEDEKLEKAEKGEALIGMQEQP